MPVNKLLSIVDASKPINENLKTQNPLLTIREIRKENRDEDKIPRDLDFTFDLEKDH